LGGLLRGLTVKKTTRTTDEKRGTFRRKVHRNLFKGGERRRGSGRERTGPRGGHSEGGCGKATEWKGLSSQKKKKNRSSYGIN